MGKIKQAGKEEKIFILTEREISYLKILNAALQFNTWKDKIISGYLYYVCTQRLGFREDQSLIFEIDLDNDKNELKTREIPTEMVKQALEGGSGSPDAPKDAGDVPTSNAS